MQVLCGLQGIFLIFNCQTPVLCRALQICFTADACFTEGKKSDKIVRQNVRKVQREEENPEYVRTFKICQYQT